MDNKKTLWAGALVAGSAVTLCCVAPLGLIPLALVTVAGGLRGKFSRTKTAKRLLNSTAGVAPVEGHQPAMKANHD